MSCCECYSCLRNRKYQKFQDSTDIEGLKEFARDLLADLVSAEGQLNYYKSIEDGSWPYAEDAAKRILARVAERRAA